MTSIGIDVGAKELVLAIRHKGRVQEAKTYKNSHCGHRQIKKLCEKYLKYGEVKIAMEATGVYYFDLAVALSESKKLYVMVINPAAIKSYANVLMTRSKTDSVDAQIIADYAEKMEHSAWKRPSEQALALRYTSRRINTLVEYKAASKNYLHALESCAESPIILIKMTQRQIEFYENQIEDLRGCALKMIQENAQLKQRYELLLTIKGFGNVSAIQFLGECVSMPLGLTCKQWVAFAGLDPRRFESGSSVRKKPGISKKGNRHMRKILFMPAMSAALSDPHIKAYVEHLVKNRGLAKLQAIAAVMRKLLHVIHAMFRHNAIFDNTRFYAIPLEG